MALQDVILLFILNFVGSMIAGAVNGPLIVRIDTDAFVLFDEKPDLLWKIPMIALCIFAGRPPDLFLAEIPHPACRETR